MSKTAKILALSKKGLDVKAIAKRLKTSTNYVYYVRWSHKGGKRKTAKKASRKAAPVKSGLSKRQANRIAKVIKLLQSI